MKKRLSAVVASTLALSALLSSCGTPEPIEPVDKSKIQIEVSVFNGGFGLDWLDEAVANFNAANEKVHVSVNPNKDLHAQISAMIQADTTTSDIFVTNQTTGKDLGLKGYLEDLSDVWAAEVDGNGTTVEDKMMDSDLFKKTYGNGESVWCLPHSEAIQGFVYDHGIFKENGWLMTESDGVTLTKGKDGVAGTYDDGQPTNITEWDLMLGKMVDEGAYPFIWTGMYASDYFNTLPEALLAQYDGLENYMVAATYEGVYTHANGTQETITPATGYKTIQTLAKKVVLEFIYKYLVQNADYYHPAAKLNSVSHTDAQNYFILGYKKTASNPQSGMLYDGVWWENEARAAFKSLEKRGEKAYAYGTRDYRYMLFPNMEGQRGANGDGTGSVIGVSENGSIYLKKQSDETKRTYAKEFIKYLVSDEVSRLFTKYTSGLRPYTYELTSEDKSAMTKFGINAYELYSDTANVKALRYQPTIRLSEMNWLTTKVVARWGTNIQGVDYTRSYLGLMNGTADEYYQGMSAYANETYWNEIYEKYLEL